MAGSNSSKTRPNKKPKHINKSTNANPTPTPNQKQKQTTPSKPKSNKPTHKEDPILFGSDSDSDSDSEPDIPSLLDPYTKPQLIQLVIDSAVSDPILQTRIKSLADSGTAHRNIFVHGLSWDTTKETLVDFFSRFGQIEECNVIVDKLTGRGKGYGFVLFKTRFAASKVLEEPHKMLKNRPVSCNLACLGGTKNDNGSNSNKSDNVPINGRKIWVGNVSVDAKPDKLREFFAKFGEIEMGPMGFDLVTGKCRGYVMFVYKNQESVRKVLEEPYKIFEGNQLHCKLANTGVVEVAKPPAPVSVPPVNVVPQQNVLAAVAAAQNMALMGQNPMYAALLAQNPLLTAAALNPGLVNYAALGGVPGVGYGGVGGSGLPGAYGGGLGLQGYQGGSSLSQGGQAGSSGAGGGGGLGGFPQSFVMK